ncbi:MAG: TIR domain-containing protein [Oscillospiraceae bacterium]|nr:TIR domain-containing protein [Oscillospiraceae bacterium]
MEHTPREVFISYHTSSCAEKVKQIVSALEASGISCWYAPRDVEGKYASSIVKAINECKVFLIILNEGANMSEHVMNEIECAFSRFSRHEDITLLPFRVDKFDMNMDIMYYLSRIHIMDGGIPPEVLKIKELINRISNILGKDAVREAVIQEKRTGEQKNYSIVGSMEYPDNCFVGRKKEIEQMAEQLAGNHNKLFLAGMGGIGKSEIAKKYCDEYRTRYDVILWVSYSEDLCHTVINDFTFPIKGLSRSEYPDMSDDEYFAHKVNILKEIADSRVLIVIDNMDVTDDKYLPVFCSGNYSVIFTTRFHNLSRNIAETEVGEITDKSEMFEMFRSEYSRNLDDEGEAVVCEILKLLNGHPLSIRLVASAMQSSRIKPHKMLEMLRSGAAEMKAENVKAADAVFGRLKQVFSVAALSWDEIHYLKNLSLMPLSGIEVEKFHDYCDIDDFDITDELVRKSWVIYNSATDEVHLHPLITELMLEELYTDLSACDTMLKAIFKELPKVDDMKFAKKRQVLRCYESINSKLPKEHPMHYSMQYGYASLLIFFGNYEKGIEVANRIFDETDSLEEHLKIINKIAKVYNELGKSEEAIAQAQRGFELVKDIPEEELKGKEGTYKRNLNIRIAEAYRSAEKYDLAEEYMRKTMDNCHIYYDSTPEEERGWTAMFLARILTRKQDETSLAEAEELFSEVMEIFRKLGNQRAQGFIYLYCCQVSMKQRKFEKALDEIHKSYDMLSQCIGKVHLNIALVHINEGNIYRFMGDEEKALVCYRKAREVLQELGERRMTGKLDKIIESKDIGYIN